MPILPQCKWQQAPCAAGDIPGSCAAAIETSRHLPPLLLWDHILSAFRLNTSSITLSLVRCLQKPEWTCTHRLKVTMCIMLTSRVRITLETICFDRMTVQSHTWSPHCFMLRVNDHVWLHTAHGVTGRFCEPYRLWWQHTIIWCHSMNTEHSDSPLDWWDYVCPIINYMSPHQNKHQADKHILPMLTLGE